LRERARVRGGFFFTLTLPSPVVARERVFSERGNRNSKAYGSDLKASLKSIWEV
jgi:hypothetical protein